MKFATLSVAALAPLIAITAQAQAPKANGDTLNVQHYAGTTGNMPAFVAAKTDLCDTYNFRCESGIINSGRLGIQTLVGKPIGMAQAP